MRGGTGGAIELAELALCLPNRWQLEFDRSPVKVRDEMQQSRIRPECARSMTGLVTPIVPKAKRRILFAKDETINFDSSDTQNRVGYGIPN